MFWEYETARAYLVFCFSISDKVEPEDPGVPKTPETSNLLGMKPIIVIIANRNI
jgi:hypothetical protein